MMTLKSADIIAGLQSDILRMQGFKPATSLSSDLGLGQITKAFPNCTFPLGAVHEFLSPRHEDTAASIAFIAGLMSSLNGKKGTMAWISASRKVFPPALVNFGLQPDRCIFIDVRNEKDAFWTMDEALKCSALSAVVGELEEIGFKESRRLQLAVEQSKVTGFIIRRRTKNLRTTACVSRWKITSLPSDPIDALPGVGFPKWRVELLRIRNGNPGAWDLQWINGKFAHVQRAISGYEIHSIDPPLKLASGSDIINPETPQLEPGIGHPESRIHNLQSGIQHLESRIEKHAG
jgi:protein ImuA